MPTAWSGISAITNPIHITGNDMTDIHTDQGSVLPAGASALVVTEDGEFTFYLSDKDPEAPVSRNVQLLVAVLLRSEDPRWVEEMISVLDDHPAC